MSNGQRATRGAVYQGRQRLGQGLAATVGKGQEGFLHVGEKKTRRTGCSENGVQGTKGEHPEGGRTGIGDVGGDAVVLSGWDGEKGKQGKGRRKCGHGFLIGCFFFFFGSTRV